MLVQLRKLGKRMKKLEKEFEAAEKQPLKQARLLRMAVSTQKRMDTIYKLIMEVEGAKHNDQEVQEEPRIVAPGDG